MNRPACDDTLEYFEWFISTAGQREKKIMNELGLPSLELDEFDRVYARLAAYISGGEYEQRYSSPADLALDFGTALGNGFIRAYPALRWLFYNPRRKDDLHYHHTVVGYFDGAVLDPKHIVERQIALIIRASTSRLPDIVRSWRSSAPVGEAPAAPRDGSCDSDRAERSGETRGRKYDDASWHCLGDAFPAALPPEAGATHIGMFVAWMFLSDRKLANVSTRTIKPLRQRATTPGAFLLRSLDGKFTSGLLTAQGNEFASSYYDFEKGEYLNDYETTLGKGLKDLYYVADTWQNYDQLKPVIDRRFAEWKARN